MLSVLIPIYNFDVRLFVNDLSKQANALPTPVEIICLDDKSDREFLEINAEIASYPAVKYLKSEVNLGRSAVRNRLEQEARFENLLFLDCDGRVVRDDYLKRYTEMFDVDVVYGGRIYQENKPLDTRLHFHWYCGMAREEVPVEMRKQQPYKSFMTNNFMIRRNVYNMVRMDEEVVGYGHEDTLFAMELKRSGISIEHIDNPLEHIGIEDVDIFLEKSANGVKNLALLMRRNKVDNSIKLVRYYRMVQGFRMMAVLCLIVEMITPYIMNNLRGAAPNLLWFDLWKLSKLHRAMDSKSSH